MHKARRLRRWRFSWEQEPEWRTRFLCYDSKRLGHEASGFWVWPCQFFFFFYLDFLDFKICGTVCNRVPQQMEELRHVGQRAHPWRHRAWNPCPQQSTANSSTSLMCSRQIAQISSTCEGQACLARCAATGLTRVRMTGVVVVVGALSGALRCPPAAAAPVALTFEFMCAMRMSTVGHVV